MNVQAVILVGGQATRLRPLTTNTSKAMVPVLNVPFLEHVIRHLARHGVSRVVLALQHLAQPVADYFGDGSCFGTEIVHVVEDGPRGTAGAVKNVENHLDGRCLVLNGDIFTDLDFTAMIDFHISNRAAATIALTPVEDPTAYGLIETDAAGRVTRFLEKPAWDEVTTNMINAGSYVLEPEVLGRIPPDVAVSIERETFPGLVADDRPVYAFQSTGYWMDAGTPEKYLQLHRDLLGGKSAWYSPRSPDEVTIGEGCAIDATAQITGPAIIGDGCSIGPDVRLTGPVVIGPGCTIGAGSAVEDTVIWRDVRLGARVTLKSSIIANDCTLGDGSASDNAVAGEDVAVLGDNVTVGRGVRLEPGARIEPGTTA
ncbi:MAG: NDP-sugar synthase [Dehalococcoidales bacterium]